MSAPICPKCKTPMQSTGSIGARGYYCPTPECTAVNGPQYVLNHAPRGARGLVEDAVCGYVIKIAQCVRCGIRVDFGDKEEARYHTMPGGCRP
ncbi:hypothetical protein ACOQFV_24355 [Nocardiopsis changdeensis]|uniref:RNHCP domain-containing protein n=1 Tax=Nocardiopsis changdeensis TaxID=2831969 RepID=A0A975KS36_9ACTN|nr:MULTISPECIES: hypothetical protein [Nocardiopsis]QUX26475.1 hypothetical protein KGD84_32775 [Nocardiopsis changdeensis]QYX40747.1 hypothetical protein K1J57_32625 [Nocardiopsis sp. MT53]